MAHNSNVVTSGRVSAPAIVLDRLRGARQSAGVSFDYELLVIGSGPAGQKAAIQAAKLRKKVALVERRSVVGGSCVNVGTIPSKTIREAIVYLTGIGQRAIYGQGYRLKDQASSSDLGGRPRY